MSSSETRLIAIGTKPHHVIPDFLEEVAKLDDYAYQDFYGCYPQLLLVDDEWLDFCNQKCGWELMEELIEFLEDNAPTGYNFGRLGDDQWVMLKEEF